jgi:chromosomal replication initiation ATPase DnaA
VAEQTGVSVDEITGKSRRKSVMKAKWKARELLKEKTDLSGAEIMLYTGSTENNHRVTRTKDTKNNQT